MCGSLLLPQLQSVDKSICLTHDYILLALAGRTATANWNQWAGRGVVTRDARGSPQEEEYQDRSWTFMVKNQWWINFYDDSIN